jgi:hypothetical protein
MVTAMERKERLVLTRSRTTSNRGVQNGRPATRIAGSSWCSASRLVMLNRPVVFGQARMDDKAF